MKWRMNKTQGMVIIRNTDISKIESNVTRFSALISQFIKALEFVYIQLKFKSKNWANILATLASSRMMF